ncbi:PREDICTED: uncharacterized protein LOC104589050 [Nelumbo nucifera]|uniref:Uncharacterized protein LOC104589050 n=2 Tax=Nelumbo nucifera TaxID=4432 RepID=A0A1U7ZCC7_NELNU|nr:PREDICTED: uncharacterized protein LOC104589050 [Nelumbo nucifera]
MGLLLMLFFSYLLCLPTEETLVSGDEKVNEVMETRKQEAHFLLVNKLAGGGGRGGGDGGGAAAATGGNGDSNSRPGSTAAIIPIYTAASSHRNGKHHNASTSKGNYPGLTVMVAVILALLILHLHSRRM